MKKLIGWLIVVLVAVVAAVALLRPDQTTEQEEASPQEVAPPAPAQERAEPPDAPAVARTEAGTIAVDGDLGDWRGEEIPAFSLRPPEPSSSAPGRAGRMEERLMARAAESVVARRMALAHDGEHLYAAIQLPEEGSMSGGPGTIYLDTDTDTGTGRKVEVHGTDLGVDRRIPLKLGIHGGTNKPTESYIAYRVEAAEGERFEPVSQKRESYQDVDWVAFEGSVIELRVPLQSLGVGVPGEFALYFEHPGVFSTPRSPVGVFSLK
ncbi:MAG: hypothetical protein R6V05_15390 [Candidatus Brocadiia bacterium]